MHWALFNQVLVKLAVVEQIDAERDANAYADQLLLLQPHLFAALDAGHGGIAARMAARLIARDHLHEVCSLRVRVEQLQATMANSSATASERLVRTAALAYLACKHDLIDDDLPHGLGLIDDCILLRGARLATPAAPGTDYLTEDILAIHYASIAVPETMLPATQRALSYFAALWQRTRDLPAPVVERALANLVQSPPDQFPSELLLPPPRPNWPDVRPPLLLTGGQLQSAKDDELVIAFPNQPPLIRATDGRLSYAS